MFKRIDLSRLQSKFQSLITAYMVRNGLSQKQLAQRVGIKGPHLSNLMTGNGRGLTATYLIPFIQKGVIMVDQINDGQATNPAEKEMWNVARELENPGAIRRIISLREKGFDIDKHLRILDESVKGSK